MREVQLANTNLTRANLSGTHVGQRNKPRGIAKNTQLNCLCCVSAGANLHLARLGKAQLRRANLSGARQLQSPLVIDALGLTMISYRSEPGGSPA